MSVTPVTPVPSLPVAPQRNNAPSTFIARADAWVADLQRWTDDINDLGSVTESNATDAESSATAASTSSASAATAATAASTSASEAAGFASESADSAADAAAIITSGIDNFQGDYSAGTNYSVGDSVLYQGSFWLSRVNSNLGNTPSESPTEWQSLNTIPTLTSGVRYIFESAGVANISVTALSSTQAVAVYTDQGDSNKGKAVLLDVAGSVITPQTPVEFEAGAALTNSVTALSSTQAIVAYRDSGDGNKGKAVLLDVAGSVITPQTPVEFEAGSTIYSTVTALSSTQAIVAYRDSGDGNKGKAVLLDVAGSVITPQTPVEFEAGSTNYVSIDAISSSQAIIAYQDSTASTSNLCVLDVAGSVITPQTPVAISSVRGSYYTVTMLTSTVGVIGYSNNDVGNTKYAATAEIFTLSGSTVTPTNNGIYFAGLTLDTLIHTAALRLNDTQIVLSSASSNSNNGVGTTSFTVLTYNADSNTLSVEIKEQIIQTPRNVSFTPTTALLDTDKIILCYDDQSNSGFGTSTILTYKDKL